MRRHEYEDIVSKEFLDSLSPIEIQFLGDHLNILNREKITEDTHNGENLDRYVSSCPECKSNKIVKNGHNKGNRQKYRCRECGKIFLSTTWTIFSKSRISYNDWLSFLAAEVNGLTLEQEAVQISRCKTTCFYMRHKLYKAVSRYNDSILHGEIEFDPTYEKINLKGRRKKDMPRLSKRRGKHRPDKDHPSLRGISHHKICILTAVDEYDHILYKIAGLGEESEEKFLPFRKQFRKNSLLIFDDKTSSLNFAKKCELKTDVIPSGEYRSKKGNSLSSVNELHRELSDLNRRKHGISTRHLQSYLDWIVFLKHIRYKTEARRRRVKSYIEIMKEPLIYHDRDICHIPLPIDLYEAYGEYHYGIYAYPPVEGYA